MPELPEVETVKNTLKQLILNSKIINIQVNYDKIIKNVTKEEFIIKLQGQVFLDIQRKGKYLIFVFNDYYLISHLRMEGKFFVVDEWNETKHDHIIFTLENNKKYYLIYNDTRKFGTMHLFSKNINIFLEYPLQTIGYEPFDKNLTKEYLFEKFKKISKPVKTTLLDQAIIAGLGNIYVNEVLFMCKINPLVKTNTLVMQDIENIINNSIIVLNKAIKLGGTTIKSFQSNHDVSGRFQNELLVHTKTTCPVCNSEIIKIKVGGRGTYYCPNCQK